MKSRKPVKTIECYTDNQIKKADKEFNEQFAKGEKMTDTFLAGVVVACDIVADADQGVLLKEIIETCGKKEVMEEIRKNGLEKTKQLALFEVKK